jgi:signal transduction histidine kinase
VFEARVAAADGPPGPALSLPVTVLPPFWRTPAFLAAVLTLGLAAAWGAHRAAVGVRVRHAEALARARADEREAVRRAAAADFHDELGHRMARIGLFAELLARGGAPSDEVPSILDRIAGEARRLADESRDFFWASGSGRDTAAAVVERLESFGGELFERSGVDFRVEGTNDGLDDVELPPEARRNMLSLFKEAMTNALRHAHCREVVLRAAVEGDRLTLLLQDDGRGFRAAAARAGHGLRNMELRARRADGTLTIASEPGAGTRVALTRRVARRGPGNALEPASADPRGDRRG